MYYEQWFVDWLKKSMLLVNIYYFFIRQWCLPKCVYNLFDTFKAKGKPILTWALQKKAIELLVICYIGGVQFVPGGHQQFQLWYWDLMPLAIEMVGFPSFVSFKWFNDIFPCRIIHPIVHHTFSLVLAAYLLTFGPDFFKKRRAIKVK